MKKKISIITVIVMLAAATAFAAPNDQTGTQNGFEQMYQYCNQVMQQWGNGNQAPQGQAQPQGQPMSYNGGMMTGNGNYGNMMGNGNFSNMMGGMMGNGNSGNMMGNGNYGNMMGSGNNGHMMGSVEFQ